MPIQTTNEFADFAIIFDYLSQPILLIDGEYKLRYINFKALSFFKENQEQFQKEYPWFNYLDLLDNKCFYFYDYLFARDDLIQELKMGTSLKVTVKATPKLFLDLHLTPVLNSNYHRTGTCIEIRDITDLIKRINQFDKAVQRAREGKFVGKIHIEGLSYDPLFEHIFRQVNTLFDTMNEFIQEVGVALEHIVQGELHYRVDVEDEVFHDHYEENCLDSIKRDLNTVLARLELAITRIRDVSNHVALGVKDLVGTNSEFAMSLENEFVGLMNGKQEIDDTIDIIRTSTSEVQQAAEIASLGQEDFESVSQKIVDQFSNITNESMENISKQIRNIQYVASAMDNFLSLHMNGLKLGLKELSSGNLGRGISMVNQECSEIIQKSGSAMAQIHETLKNMVDSFNESVHTLQNIAGEVTNNMSHSVQIIHNLSSTMEAIRGVSQIQSDNFSKIADFMSKIHLVQDTTMQSAEVVISAVCELMNVSKELEEAVQIRKKGFLDDFYS